MSAVEVLLDVLRMAQLPEDELRKSDRAALEAAVKGFQSLLRTDATRSVAEAAAVAADAAGVGVAGWRNSGVGGWATMRISQLARDGGRDGSDFALVLAALVHSLGGKVRLSVVCAATSSVGLSASASSGGGGGGGSADADAADAADDGPAPRAGQRCRLVTEARVGFHPDAAARWVGERHAAGAGALGAPPPLLHFRREDDGSTWLSLAWQPPPAGSEAQPGGAYLPAAATDGATEWTTFYPFDEHGCKWHVRGAEGDSAGKAHTSAPPRAVHAIVKDGLI